MADRIRAAPAPCFGAGRRLGPHGAAGASEYESIPSPTLAAGLLFCAARRAFGIMRDKKDNATLDLPGFGAAAELPPACAETRRAPTARARRNVPRQQQLELLEETDASGLPVWRREAGTDLTGLPNWAPA
jgi:hypothetical protein